MGVDEGALHGHFVGTGLKGSPTARGGGRRMMLPRRRIKVAPKYIAVSLEDEKIKIPSRVSDNEQILRGIKGLATKKANKNERKCLTTSAIPPVPAKKLGLTLDLLDIIIETSFTSIATPDLPACSRKIAPLARDEQEEAVSIWAADPHITDCDAEELCRISLIKSTSGTCYITFDDVCRIIEFIGFGTVDQLEDKFRRKIRSMLSSKWGLTKINKGHELFAQVIAYTDEEPQPIPRKGVFWVVLWDHLDQLVSALLQTDGHCVTIL